MYDTINTMLKVLDHKSIIVKYLSTDQHDKDVCNRVYYLGTLSVDFVVLIAFPFSGS